MTLGELIKTLEKYPADQIVERGFGSPDSYRGDYSQLAFNPEVNVTVGEMLDHAKSAVGRTFQGYKGGSFTMSTYTDCYIAEYGNCGEQIGELLLWYMLGEPND